MDSRAIVRVGIGFYMVTLLFPYESPDMGSMSFWLPRNVVCRSCVSACGLEIFQDIDRKTFWARRTDPSGRLRRCIVLRIILRPSVGKCVWLGLKRA